MSRPSRRAVVALLASTATAFVGTRVSAIALPWFVLITSGSPALTGLVVACEMGPYVTAKVLSGPLVDRFGQRRSSITCDLLSGLVFGLIPVLHLFGSLSLPLLLILVGIGGALRGPGDNAKYAAVPVVAEQAELPLARLTGLFGTVDRGSGLVAPGAAALAIGWLSPTGALMITALGFVASALVWRLLMPVLSRPESGSTSGYVAELAEGLRFLARQKLLLTLVIMLAVTNLLDIGRTAVLMPVWAERGGHGVSAIAILLTCFAVTSVGSSLVASFVGHRLPRRPTYVIAFALAGPPPFLVLALDAPLWVLGAVFAVGGFASGFLNPMLGAIFFERIPRPMLARVEGVASAGSFAGYPFGGLVAAALIAATGLAPALVIFGLAYVLATLLPALTRHSFDPPDPDTGIEVGRGRHQVSTSH